LDPRTDDAQDPDRALLVRLKAGDRQALDTLMERHYVRLYRVLLGYLRDADDALDAVQETFVKAFEHAARYDPAAGVAPWLTRIGINLAIDKLRRRKRWALREQPLEFEDGPREIEAPAASADQAVFGREIQERVTRALLALPESQRAVFTLRHYDQLSLEEIATTLEMNLGTVKSSLHRALVHLRRRLVVLR
jgi:RNA polymerase sigma-70 factor (ECF subfamily)